MCKVTADEDIGSKLAAAYAAMASWQVGWMIRMIYAKSPMHLLSEDYYPEVAKGYGIVQVVESQTLPSDLRAGCRDWGRGEMPGYWVAAAGQSD